MSETVDDVIGIINQKTTMQDQLDRISIHPVVAARVGVGDGSVADAVIAVCGARRGSRPPRRRPTIPRRSGTCPFAITHRTSSARYSFVSPFGEHAIQSHRRNAGQSFSSRVPFVSIAT